MLLTEAYIDDDMLWKKDANGNLSIVVGEGYFWIHPKTDITELPENLTVYGDMKISCKDFTKLPDNMTVVGNLDLSGSGITKLPKNLVVFGDLMLFGEIGRKIYLPYDLQVEGKVLGLNSCGRNYRKKDN